MIYTIDNITFSYRPSSPRVLNGVSLTLDEGELLTVMGKNGAGKSTLLGCMLGLLHPQNGKITLYGSDVSSMRPKEIASYVSYVPQNHTPTFGYTVFDFVLMGCASRVGLMSHPGQKERDDAAEAIEKLGISHLADRNYSELSGGERQQATIARAVAAKPRAILFDEPTAHLDVGNQLRVLRIIKSLSDSGYAVAVTTHDPNHSLLLGGKAALFSADGTVRTGPVEELVTEDNLSTIYGEGLKLRYMEEFGRNVCISPALEQVPQ